MMYGPGIRGPITEYKIVDQRWKTGIPLALEEREAARFAGMSYAEYLELPGTHEVALLWHEADCKCDVIMHYRMMGRVDAVSIDLHKRFPKKT